MNDKFPEDKLNCPGNVVHNNDAETQFLLFMPARLFSFSKEQSSVMTTPSSLQVIYGTIYDVILINTISIRVWLVH